MKWQEQLCLDLENKGIIQDKKGKHFLTESKVKEELEKEIKEILGNKKEPSARLKAIIGFFKHTRQLRFISKEIGRDKQWVKIITED